MTLICFLKILKITPSFPFYQFPIQRPHIWSKAVIPLLIGEWKHLIREGVSAGVTLPLYQWGAEMPGRAVSPPRAWRFFQDTLFWGARQRVRVVYHMHCRLCLVRSSKPLWEEEVSARKEMGIPSGNEMCLRSLSQLTSQAMSSRGGASA